MKIKGKKYTQVDFNSFFNTLEDARIILKICAEKANYKLLDYMEKNEQDWEVDNIKQNTNTTLYLNATNKINETKGHLSSKNIDKILSKNPYYKLWKKMMKNPTDDYKIIIPNSGTSYDAGFRFEYTYTSPYASHYFIKSNFFELYKNHRDEEKPSFFVNKRQYSSLIECIRKFDAILLKEKEEKEKIDLFNNNQLKEQYKNISLENYDLSENNFDNKNISGLNISKNTEVHINFDKIEKDISNCNFNGYNLSKEILKDFNIKDTDLRETGATIDLATCNIALEGKMSPGTLFDSSNTFVFGGKVLNEEEVTNLGIKVYRKV